MAWIGATQPLLMSSRSMVNRNRRAGCGCLILIAILTACQPDTIQPAQPAGFTTLPNAATRDALEGTAHVLALTATVTPSATITNTAPAPTATSTAPAAQVQADTNVSDMTSFAPISYTVRSTANARSCPDTQCDSLGKLSAGQTIIVDGGGHGGDFKGSNVWVRTNINGQVAYVHSSLVIESSLVAQPLQVQSTTPPVVSSPVQQAWNCIGDNYNCNSFSSRADLMAYFNSCPGDPSDLDHDGNNIPCESN